MSVSTQEYLLSSAAPAADAAWSSLAGAASAEQLCESWLEILCGTVASVQTGLLLLQDADGSYAPAAAWPRGTELQHLADIAKDALAQRQGVRRQLKDHPTQLAYPLIAADRLHGVVVLELLVPDEALVRQAARLTHWGAGWLVELFGRRELLLSQQRLRHSGFVFDATLAALAESDFRQACLVVVNRLAAQFGCQQVQLGLERGASISLAAVSHSAWFDERANLLRLALDAMNEALDQRRPLCLPEPEPAPGEVQAIAVAQQRYADESGCAALCTLPVGSGPVPTAVLMLERDKPFEPSELSLLQTLSEVLAPVLELKREHEESLLQHGRRALRSALSRLGDASHPGLKLAGALLGLFLIVAALLPVDYRVSSAALVEGAVQRAAVAPFEGYLRDAAVRAGDVVKKGQLMARLEDRDLLLERVRWEAELEVAQRKEREAMSLGDRVNQRLSAAQANQARAQLELVLERLARVNVLAPFDGIVVKGDLSQQLGSPVEQGKLLFEVAPLNAWRVILKIDERDIGHIAVGQPGQLRLTGMPGTAWGFKVRSVTPVSVAEEGRNFFRVEAELDDAKAQLRPNMEGVAKVSAGERALLWTWTHRFTDWLRMSWWHWTP